MSIENVLTWDQPFGPNATEKIAQNLFHEILDDTNSAYSALRTRPFLIVGRRGSGKTSMLSAIELTGQFSMVVSVPPSQAFQNIVKVIDQAGSDTVLDESVGEAWEKIIWNFVFLKFYNENATTYPKESVIVRNYLKSVGLKSNSLPGQLMQFLLRAIKKDTQAADDAVALLNEILDARSGFIEVRDTVTKLFKRSKIKCVVLIDNIEQIDLSIGSVRKSIAGLLMAIDSFKNAEVPIDVRCCIPSEIFPKLSELASNSEKSLDSKLVLHWSSNELLHMAAIRYREFLKFYATSDVIEKVNRLRLGRQDGLDSFMHEFFPRTIRNGLGYEEVTLRYILRHTQLLPRQFITYLNEIARRSFDSRTSDTFKFSEESIVDGVRAQEGLVCQGVFSGYRTIYPNARDVCKVILPQLPLTFRYGDFQVLFRRQAGKLNDKLGEPFFSSELECLAMLTEIGAVGVKVSEDSEYITAEFSYNLPLDLALRVDDIFCLHPAFSGNYRSDMNEATYKPIFPKLG